MEAKLKKIIATLLKAGPDPKGGNGRKSKATVFQHFQLQFRPADFKQVNESWGQPFKRYSSTK